MSYENDTISTHDYDKTHPIYIKIRKEFSEKLKSKYNCENFDKIVDYVMYFVFEKKATKAECINNMNSLFNGKADIMMDYLWKLTEEIENSSNEYSERKKWKLNKYGNRERSRSHSYEKNKFNKFNYYKYKGNMTKRGFYPPKMRYSTQMIPLNMAYAGAYQKYLIQNQFLMKR